ncbi:ATP-binding cassette domain-containing protein [Spirulina subsalsa FACHB-351]|uniref:ATP-binding cassette domain-containing protein n=1 Tax=Spirulina subsalsa FACHB-351 TaxID=234711 RepID=A0ABT3L134_9CYAN|nr:ATP-binding cassette domain-containing protein [Spirulina subsalsa]MCW6035177.1 ATP-binding cassette domain-containing protein [Spirulina subsalsa FACHB-351]
MVSSAEIVPFLSRLPPFDRLPMPILDGLAAVCRVQSYGEGDFIDPHFIQILYQGTIQLCGHDPLTEQSVPLRVQQRGCCWGWLELWGGVRYEEAIATTAVLTLAIPPDAFFPLFSQYPPFAAYFQQQVREGEVYWCLRHYWQSEELSPLTLAEFVGQISPQTLVYHCPPHVFSDLAPEGSWFVTGGAVASLTDRYTPYSDLPLPLEMGGLVSEGEVRLLNFPLPLTPPRPSYPFVSSTGGAVENAIACFEMVADYFGVACPREPLKRVLEAASQRRDLSWSFYRAIAQRLGLTPTLLTPSHSPLPHLKPPALLYWGDHLAVLYQVGATITLAVPPVGLLEYSPQEFQSNWKQQRHQQILSLESPSHPSPLGSLKQLLGQQIQQHFTPFFLLLSLSLISTLFSLSPPIILQILIDQVFFQQRLAALNSLAILLLFLIIGQITINQINLKIWRAFAHKINQKILRFLFQHFSDFFQSPLDKNKLGEVLYNGKRVSLITSFLDSELIPLLLNSSFCLLGVILLSFYSIFLTLIVLFSLLFCLLLSSFLFSVARQSIDTQSNGEQQFQQNWIQSLLSLQILPPSLHQRDTLQQTIQQQLSLSWRQQLNLQQNLDYTLSQHLKLYQSIGQITVGVILWVGSHLVVTQQLSLGQFIAFGLISQSLFIALSQGIAVGYQWLKNGLPWQSIQDTTISSSPLSLNSGKSPLSTLHHSLQLKNIILPHFIDLYPKQQPINFTLRAGEWLGITGKSGAGKTTLIQLLSLARPCPTGQILWDGRNINQMNPQLLHHHIAIASQELPILPHTIAENLAPFQPPMNLEQIEEICQITRLHPWVMTLPQQYDTLLGKNGLLPSEAEQQKIILTRCLLQNPSLLILDQVTQAIVPEELTEIMHNLRYFYPKMTVILVSRYADCLQHTDRILVMDYGAVIEEIPRGGNSFKVLLQSNSTKSLP